MNDVNLFNETIKLAPKNTKDERLRARIRRLIVFDYKMYCREEQIGCTEDGLESFYNQQIEHLLNKFNTCKSWEQFLNSYCYTKFN